MGGIMQGIILGTHIPIRELSHFEEMSGRNVPRSAYGGMGGVKGYNIYGKYITEKPGPLRGASHDRSSHPHSSWIG